MIGAVDLPTTISENTLLPEEGAQSESDLHKAKSAELFPAIMKFPAACRFFVEKARSIEGHINATDIVQFLKQSGLLQDDPRLKSFYQSLMTSDHEFKRNITIEEFAQMLSNSSNATLIEKAFQGNLIVPDFQDFCLRIKKLFIEVKSSVPSSEGKAASYIPKLANVDPNLFGLSVCTIDGQRYHIGDSHVEFSVQSCIKPLTYCFALEQHGTEKVHQHIGREPSGVAFNSLCLNSANLPHNPMINAGAIMACSLVKPNEPIYNRFEHVNDQLYRLSGDLKWGFSNIVYLSEKQHADSNFCLGYMMQGHNAFPEGTNLTETLDFYFQCCSLETDCNRIAIAGATLANMGECPTTGKKVFKSRTCRDSVSLMYSCGMYDYSGEWAFTVGIPAKSGVSGCIYAIIPDFGCISVYSPPLDTVGNSVRGVKFFSRLVEEFIFHNFDSLKQTGTRVRINPRLNKVTSERQGKMAALYAAAEGDLIDLKRLIRSGVSPGTADYDGRTLLHLAASCGKGIIVKFLLRYPEVNVNAKDRWGGTPHSDALKAGHHLIAKMIEQHLEHRDSLEYNV
ncbi:hypothetical protein HDV06_003522 [Boothiomyces sp. JEL0866]|nr:hypothetical protein HDV06_003490 [Boothiomyces sp. JEL0866]KAJ3325752.1 hypothetical protein HDV06_003522 [Boothiomyces sp. JEL0866]